VRIVFLGTPATAVPSLGALLEAGHTFPLVVTQPDRPAGRSKTPVLPPVKVWAEGHGVPVIQPVKVRTAAFRDAVASARPDVLVVVAYGRILPKPVLDAAPHGAINLHFSLLPKLRGAAPVAWALAAGEITTGVTTFRLDEGLDTGDVLLQREAAVEPREHAPALLARLSGIGAALLVETLAGLTAGTLVPVPQEPRAATQAPILTRADGAFAADWTAAALEGRVRGFDPWPGVWAECARGRLRLLEVEAIAGRESDAPAGSLLALEADAVCLACAGRTVARVGLVQPDGRRAMTAREAVNGRQIALGERIVRPEPEA
jgi:methionyl-tRNA formyltransferase